MGKEPILCYIDGPWAYFTTQSLQKQWGDDWDDRPYECNAGTPYGPHDDDEPWEIVKVAWDGDFCEPKDGFMSPRPNSCWSVKDINKKCVPWLQRAAWKKEPAIQIWAGAKLSEFKKLIRKGGGDVYVRES